MHDNLTLSYMTILVTGPTNTCLVPLPSTILKTHQWQSVHQHKWFERCMVMAALQRRLRPCLLFCMCCHLPEKSNAVCFLLGAGIHFPSTKLASVTKIPCAGDEYISSYNMQVLGTEFKPFDLIGTQFSIISRLDIYIYIYIYIYTVHD